MLGGMFMECANEKSLGHPPDEWVSTLLFGEDGGSFDPGERNHIYAKLAL